MNYAKLIIFAYIISTMIFVGVFVCNSGEVSNMVDMNWKQRKAFDFLESCNNDNCFFKNGERK